MEMLRFTGCAVLGKSSGHEFFSLNQIIEITGLNRIAVRRVMEQFNREKLILKITKRPNYFKGEIAFPKGRPPLSITYHLNNKKKLIERIAPKLKENTSQDRIWRVIRARIDFTVQDLIVLAEVGRENARWFTKMLRRAGIIKQVSRGQWRLVKDLGPRRPYVGDQIQAKRKAHNE